MWHERTSPLDPSSPNQFWEKEKERENKESFCRERVSTFSLNFPVISPTAPYETRGKVAPHYKGYAWVPILWIFDISEK